MKMLTLPVALSLVTGLAFAAPPAKTGSPNAKGVARSTAVRNEGATENADGPARDPHELRPHVVPQHGPHPDQDEILTFDPDSSAPGGARRRAFYCRSAYSCCACFRIGTSGSASFQRAKKSW